MSHSPGTRGCRGALLGASESSCGRIPCGATKNVTPPWATGLATGAAKTQGRTGPGSEAEPGQEQAKQAEARTARAGGA